MIKFKTLKWKNFLSTGDKWTEKQKKRAALLFELYPDIKQAYSLTHSLRMIFSQKTNKGVAYTKMAKWFSDVTQSEFKSFNTISATFYSHYREILNFFDNRSTNASAESFNAKLKHYGLKVHRFLNLTKVRCVESNGIT